MVAFARRCHVIFDSSPRSGRASHAARASASCRLSSAPLLFLRRQSTRNISNAPSGATGTKALGQRPASPAEVMAAGSCAARMNGYAGSCFAEASAAVLSSASLPLFDAGAAASVVCELGTTSGCGACACQPPPAAAAAAAAVRCRFDTGTTSSSSSSSSSPVSSSADDRQRSAEPARELFAHVRRPSPPDELLSEMRMPAASDSASGSPAEAGGEVASAPREAAAARAERLSVACPAPPCGWPRAPRAVGTADPRTGASARPTETTAALEALDASASGAVPRPTGSLRLRPQCTPQALHSVLA
mmetsp:Transcript_18721/g.61120  ORF Transcript_18721/g.61120 Transcript_18721/m.61120 type:complete len:304 (-) Transcript_18721:344-1255(-)